MSAMKDSFDSQTNYARSYRWGLAGWALRFSPASLLLMLALFLSVLVLSRIVLRIFEIWISSPTKRRLVRFTFAGANLGSHSAITA